MAFVSGCQLIWPVLYQSNLQETGYFVSDRGQNLGSEAKDQNPWIRIQEF